MQEYQQFSTPPHIAYTVSWIANIDDKDVVLEPSADIGGLAMFGKMAGAGVIVNEYSERRLELMKSLPFDRYYKEDAAHLHNILPNDIKPTVVVMNPPFSATAGKMGNKRNTQFAKPYIEQALKRLEPGGRLVAIVGRGMAEGKPTFRDWWDELKKDYNVRANVSVGGYVYRKYGTIFDFQVLVIDKTGPTTKPVVKNMVTTLKRLTEVLEEIANDRPAISFSTKPTDTEPISEKTTDKSESGNQSDDAARSLVDDLGPGEPGSGDLRVAGDRGDREDEPVGYADTHVDEQQPAGGLGLSEKEPAAGTDATEKQQPGGSGGTSAGEPADESSGERGVDQQKSKVS
ncbi:MAG: hypothetical protein WBI21_06110 [Natronincolaceae bacterium]|jgi:hypothetical protein